MTSPFSPCKEVYCDYEDGISIIVADEEGDSYTFISQHPNVVEDVDAQVVNIPGSVFQLALAPTEHTTYCWEDDFTSPSMMLCGLSFRGTLDCANSVVEDVARIMGWREGKVLYSLREFAKFLRDAEK